jgi:hypothetical protein
MNRISLISWLKLKILKNYRGKQDVKSFLQHKFKEQFHKHNRILFKIAEVMVLFAEEMKIKYLPQ